MSEAVQIANLVMNGLTLIGFLGGLAAVFIRIGRREEQIDHLARSVARQSDSTDRLNLTLRAIEVTMARMEQAQGDFGRRLDRIENVDEGGG